MEPLDGLEPPAFPVRKGRSGQVSYRGIKWGKDPCAARDSNPGPYRLILQRHLATAGLSRGARRPVPVVHDGPIVSLSGAGAGWADQTRSGPDVGKEGVEMAVLVVGEAAGVTAEQDAALTKRLYPEGSLPA